ncbi:hypothetical protein GJAV_G00233560 [Gymnothorax javanicus]|nr:hypothetical protein GJAV_G00233560 [Gymnothorax javanicus]
MRRRRFVPQPEQTGYTMDTADELIEKLLFWLEQRKHFAEQLRKMARELESLHKNLKATQCYGSSVSVIGAASLLGAGVLTLCTGGAAAPVLATVGAVYGGVGLTISLSAKVAEAWSSSSSLKDAKKIMEDNEKLGLEIKKLVKQLMQLCMEEADAAGSSEDADRYATGYIARGIARQRGLQWTTGLDNWFQNSSRFGMHHFQTSSTAHRDILSAIGIGCLTLGLWEILKNKSLQRKLFGTGGKLLLLTLKESADEMATAGMSAASNLFKDVAVKTMAKGLAQAGGGALGLALSLPEAIDNWKDMIENNHVSEASQSMKDAAKQLERANSDLRKELDDIGAMLKEIERVSCYIKSMTYSLNINEEGLFVVNFIKRNTNNDQINNWLYELSHSAQFLNLLGYFYQELRKSSFPQGQVRNRSCATHSGQIGHSGLITTRRKMKRHQISVVSNKTIQRKCVFRQFNCSTRYKVCSQTSCHCRSATLQLSKVNVQSLHLCPRGSPRTSFYDMSESKERRMPWTAQENQRKPYFY